MSSFQRMRHPISRKIFIIGLLAYSFFMHGSNKCEIPENIINMVEKKYDHFARNRLLSYNKMMQESQDKDEMEKLIIVNDFFNNVPYKSDQENWNQKDYWATPLEFLSRDRGDCEDYVIAKLFALKNLGVDPNKLFMTYVRSTRFNSPHMVLTYFQTPSSEPLILDNTNFKVFPASKRTDLTPIYNFNGDSLRIFQKRGTGEQVKINQKTHKKWDNLIQDIKRNKL